MSKLEVMDGTSDGLAVALVMLLEHQSALFQSSPSRGMVSLPGIVALADL